MTEVTETAIVDSDAGLLWREAGGFGSIGSWHPLLNRVEVDGAGPGAVRRAYGRDGSMQVERLLFSDPVRRELRYAIEQTRLPVKNWHALFRIESAGGAEPCDLDRPVRAERRKGQGRWRDPVLPPDGIGRAIAALCCLIQVL